MVEALRAHKSQLMELVGEDGRSSPPRIRPEMLPLIRLTQEEIDGMRPGVRRAVCVRSTWRT